MAAHWRWWVYFAGWNCSLAWMFEVYTVILISVHLDFNSEDRISGNKLGIYGYDMESQLFH
jgi:hypothetical protein